MKHELFTFIKPHGGKINMKSLGSCSFLQQEQVIDLSTVISGHFFLIQNPLSLAIYHRCCVPMLFYSDAPPPPQIVYEITHIVAYITSIVYY